MSSPGISKCIGEGIIEEEEEEQDEEGESNHKRKKEDDVEVGAHASLHMGSYTVISISMET